MNLLTHVVFGLAVSEILGLDIFFVVLGSIIPDFDYLFGITHRTIMHSLIFVLLLSFFIIRRNKRSGVSFLLGLFSHLLLDVLTTQGVMLLWPVNTFFGYGLFNSLDVSPNLLFIFVFFVLLWNKDIISYKLSAVDSKQLRLVVYSLFILPVVFAVPFHYYQILQCDAVSLSGLLSDVNVFNEECVTVRGSVCSAVKDYSSSNNDYLFFDLCEGGDSIIIWLLKNLDPGIEAYDNITVTGLFTKKFVDDYGYEIYMVKSIRKD